MGELRGRRTGVQLDFEPPPELLFFLAGMLLLPSLFGAGDARNSKTCGHSGNVKRRGASPATPPTAM